MRVLIIYCHPSENSFTAKVREHFVKGLELSGHTYEISDLYKMGFYSEFSEEEYLRDAFYTNGGNVDADIKVEQEKIQRSDIITFIYPVFWTEAPAKLVGWFDRVWTYGFAYGENSKMKVLRKALFLVTTGKSLEELKSLGQKQAMETVMLHDRINYRAKEKQMYFFSGMSRMQPKREDKIPDYLEQAYKLGLDL